MYAGGELRSNTHRFLTVRLSATSMVSFGLATFSIAAISLINASSAFVRPAVSSMTTSTRPACPLAWHAWQFQQALPFNNGRFRHQSGDPVRQAVPSPPDVGVQRGHQHFAFVFFLKAPMRAWRCWWFYPALQADHHNADRRHRIQRQRLSGAQHVNQFVIDDLDNLLTRRHRFQHFRADRARAHTVNKSAHNGQRYIGFQQGFSNIAQRGFNIAFGQRTAAAQRSKTEPNFPSMRQTLRGFSNGFRG